ncbi:MAG: hypothetical protein ACO2ZM_05650 [Francisellaceae bacterium]
MALLNQQPSYISSQSIPIGENAAGETISITLIEVKGKNSNAPSAYIQASVHAAEIQGNAVIMALMNHFHRHQPQGNITLVPQCNPIGMNHHIGSAHQGRFDPMTGDNWNRFYLTPKIDIDAFVDQHINTPGERCQSLFRRLICENIDKMLHDRLTLSRARRLNLTLQKQAALADIVLDLHTDDEAIDYLYSPAYAKEEAAHLGFKHILVLDNHTTGALDEAIFFPWWSLQQRFQQKGRQESVWIQSFTLELGSQERIDSKKAKTQADGILAYLITKQVIEADTQETSIMPTPHYHEIKQFKAIHGEHGGLYEWLIKPGDFIKKGQCIGFCLKMAKLQSIDITLPFDATIISINGKGALPQSAHILNVVDHG